MLLWCFKREVTIIPVNLYAAPVVRDYGSLLASYLAPAYSVLDT